MLFQAPPRIAAVCRCHQCKRPEQLAAQAPGIAPGGVAQPGLDGGIEVSESQQTGLIFLPHSAQPAADADHIPPGQPRATGKEPPAQEGDAPGTGMHLKLALVDAQSQVFQKDPDPAGGGLQLLTVVRKSTKSSTYLKYRAGRSSRSTKWSSGLR